MKNCRKDKESARPLLLKSILKNERGVAFLQFFILIPLLCCLWIFVFDGINTRYTAGQVKTALNHAVKGAVLAVDTEKLAIGELKFKEEESLANFYKILRLNLKLAEDLSPGSFAPICDKLEIIDFFIYDGPGFPYTHRSALDIEYIFNDPGVFVLVKAKHRGLFSGEIQDIYAYAAAEAKGGYE